MSQFRFTTSRAGENGGTIKKHVPAAKHRVARGDSISTARNRTEAWRLCAWRHAQHRSASWNAQVQPRNFPRLALFLFGLRSH
jgi:hypothetical protein